MNILSWVVRRPYCQPQAVIILARSAGEALALSSLAYGACRDAVAVRPDRLEAAVIDIAAERNGSLEAALVKAQERERRLLTVLREAIEWAGVQTGEVRQGADRYFADAARALIAEEG